MFYVIQWCSGAGTHGNAVPTQFLMWERRSHKRNFERYICMFAIKLAIFHYYHVSAFRAPQTMSKRDIRICKALAH